MTTIAITAPVFEELATALAWPVETAWLMTARVSRGGKLLLARDLRSVPEEAYRRRTGNRLEITSAGFVGAFKSAAADCAIPIFVHTHPGARAGPSEYDDVVDDLLRSFAVSRGLRGYASLIVGGLPQALQISGRLWLDDRSAVAIGRLRVAGPRLRLLLAATVAGETFAMFDRHVRAFGVDGQRLLAQMTIGVVGAGGTGSPTVEQLARLGVGTVVVFDDDTVSESNLTRIHASCSSDIGVEKVEVVKRGAEGAGTGTTVVAIAERVTTADAVEMLSRCDVVFGCTDDHAGRLVLSRLAYQFLIPVIDCGVTIRADGGAIHDVTGRVTYVAPGTPCLICRGQVDVLAAGQQMLPAEPRAALADEGYARDLDDEAPAVVAFTTAVSALAVNELLARLFGYGDDPPGQLLVRFGAREIRRAGQPARGGHYCTDSAQWALGESDPPLGIIGLA